MTVNIVPVAQPRHRISGNRRYIPKEHPIHAYKELLRLSYDGEMLEGALSLDVVFYLPEPKKGRALPIVRPDLDNYVKAVLDALNGVAYVDDSQIINLHAQKRYGEPRVVVTVAKL